MKHVKFKAVLIAVLLMTGNAYAGRDYGQDVNVGANALAGAASFSQGGAGGASTLNNTTEAADYGDLRIVPPAIAPSVNTGVICPMISPRSSAFSVFFLSMSGTTGQSINGLCVAHHSGQKEMVHQIACDEDGAYRKAANALGIECK